MGSGWQRYLHVAVLAAAVVALALIVRHIGALLILRMLRQVGWTFVLVVALYALHTGLRGVALWQTLPPRSIPLRTIVRIRFGAEGVEMLTLTGPFMAEPAKAWLLHRHGLDGPDAVGAVVTEYLLYNLTSSWVAGWALSLLLVRGMLPRVLQVPAEIMLVSVLLLTGGCAIAAVTGRGLIRPALSPVLRALAPLRADAILGNIGSGEARLVSVLHDDPVRLGKLIAVELASHALLAMEIVAILGALGFHPGLLDSFVVEGAAKTIGALFFFVPGQLGVAEGIFSVLLPVIGLPAAAGVTISLVRRARALAVGGVGFLVAARAPIPSR